MEVAELEVVEQVVEVAEQILEVAEQVLEVAEQILEVAEQVLEVAEQVLEVAEQVLEVAGQVFNVAGRVFKLAGRLLKKQKFGTEEGTVVAPVCQLFFFSGFSPSFEPGALSNSFRCSCLIEVPLGGPNQASFGLAEELRIL